MIYRCDTLDPYFLQYLVDKVEDIFMASYLPDETDIPSTSRGTSLEMHLTNQYCLDKDSDEPIALGIGILVLKVPVFCLFMSLILICYPLCYI